MKKFWLVLRCLGWALAHMPEAEMEYHRRKRLCSNCGGPR